MCVGEVEIDLDKIRSKRRKDAFYAQRFFHYFGPREAPRLPLSNVQYWELIHGTGIQQITCWYARSLALSGYRFRHHPDFEAFASGVMASNFTPRHILTDIDLKFRFLPYHLEGLGPELIWLRPGDLPEDQEIARWPSSNSRIRRQGTR
jgi:hypothetical protein